MAEVIAEAVCRRYPDEVQAVGVPGALAAPDDADDADLELVVVTRATGVGPRPSTRRIDGVIVDFGVIAAPEYLRHARALSTSWPLAAGQYLTTMPLCDPDGWYDLLRDTHLARLAEATDHEFAALAREAWCHARSAYTTAVRLAGSDRADGALLTLGEARLGAALVEGLLHRTYFRTRADAVGRTGLGDTDIAELGRRLDLQAEELSRRGRPVDAVVDDLVD